MTASTLEDLENLAAETVPAASAAVDAQAASAATAKTETAKSKELTARGKALQEIRRLKVDALFQDKKYRIAKKIELEKPRTFTTPFGNKGSKGFALIMVDGCEPNEGCDRMFVVGASVVRDAIAVYDAITNADEFSITAATGRTRMSPADKAAAAAEKAAEVRRQTLALFEEFDVS